MRAVVQCEVYMGKNPQKNYESETLPSNLPCTLKGHKTLLIPAGSNEE